jgi:hypothetical protein
MPWPHTTMEWTKRAVLERAHVYGSVESNDQYGNNKGKPANLCNAMVEEGLLQRDGYARYVITDKGREYAVGIK